MTVKSASHFVDSDIQGTSGLDAWTSDNFGYGVADPAKTQIRTAQELQDMQNDLAGDYELMNNIDMEGFDWTPIGNFIQGVNTDNFTGTFEGNYFTISNLYYDAGLTDYAGLFGRLKGATIQNLLFADFEIHGRSQIGCLAGGSENSDITLCGGTGTIYLDRGTDTHSQIGGLLGGTEVAIELEPLVQKCWAVVDIYILWYWASLDNQIGGLIGDDGGMDVQDCWAGGNIIHSGETTFRQYSSATGGLIGNGASSVGEYPRRCHSYGAIISSGSQAADKTHRIGGFTGWQSVAAGVPAAMADCHWDTTTSTLTWGANGYGPPTDDPVVGLTGHLTAASQQQATYENWDFDDVWEIDENTGYPTLQWVTTNPHQIKTGEQNRTTAMPTDHAHLNGETVQVLGDGSYLGTEVVAGGAIDLDDNTTINHVGLRFISKIQPMKIDGEVRVKRIGQLIPNFHETVGGDYGEDEDNLYSMVLKASGDPLDTDGDLHTGYIELPFDGSYNRQGDIWITQDIPLGMNLLGLGVRGQAIINEEAIEQETAAPRGVIPATDRKRALSMVLNMNNSIQGEYGVDEDNVFGIDDDNEDLFTGHKDLVFDDGYDYNVDVYVQQDQPLPMRVIGMGVRVGG